MPIPNNNFDQIPNLILSLICLSELKSSRSRHIERTLWKLHNKIQIMIVHLSHDYHSVVSRTSIMGVHIQTFFVLWKRASVQISSSLYICTALITVLPMVHWNFCFIIHRVQSTEYLVIHQLQSSPSIELSLLSTFHWHIFRVVINFFIVVWWWVSSRVKTTKIRCTQLEACRDRSWPWLSLLQ